MKQALKIFGLLLITFSLTLVSCGDDDKDEPDNPSASDSRHDPALVGQWVMIPTEEDDEYLRYEFYDDGELIIFVKDDYDSDTEVMEWETRNGSLIMTFWCDDHQMYEKERSRYTVRNGILTLTYTEDGESYTTRFRKI